MGSVSGSVGTSKMRTFVVIALVTAAMAFGAEPEKPGRTISVTAQRYHFHPAEIRVKKGELVELVFTSLDTDHGLLIPHLKLRGLIPPKGRGALRVRFRGSEVGRCWFESSHPSGAGYTLMRGVIEVE